MYVKYGSFQHDNTNPAVVERFTVDPVRDDRGIWRTTKKRMYLRGQIIASTQAAIRTGLDSLKNAYDGDNYDAALYEDDGTRSHFYLTSSDSLGGVRIVGRDYPNLGEPGEYCSGVNYRIALEAEYPANEASPMVWREQLEYSGNTGLRYGYIEPVAGPAIRYIEQQQTLQHIVQSGYALALTGWPLVADPLFPDLELRHRRVITAIGPQAAGANLRYTHFGMRWSYEFLSPVSQTALPGYR